MSDVTRLLEAAAAGDRRAAADLLPLVYDELRKLAGAQMAGERTDHTLNATALVHEAYLRLGGDRSFESKSHFLRVAAESMRRILVDHARTRAADKRGGRSADRIRVPLDDYAKWIDSPDGMVDLDEALNRFAIDEPQKAELVNLRFFGGMTMPEVAKTLGISLPTAERWWAYARIWLYAHLSKKIDEP